MLILCTSMPVLIKHLSTKDIIISCLDAVTFSIPAELPVAMSIGVIFALRRLKRVKISWVNVSKINVSGRVSTMVFDKTGTLTETGVSVAGVKIFNEGKFERKIKINDEQKDFELWERLAKIMNDSSFYKQSNDVNCIKYLEWMASWHSLIVLNNSIVGDPLETEMFKITKWKLDEEIFRDNRKTLVQYPRSLEYRLKKIYQFDFLPELQRMSVIAKNNYDSKFNLYVKGSPEKIFELCRKDSLPKDFFEVLKKYTESGKRVIAFAFRELQNFNEEEKHNRTELEQDLVFLGFLIFLNKLKPESISSIEKLKKGKNKINYLGNVTTMMATGDNLRTGIAMAKAWGILTSESVVTVELNQSSK